MADIDVFNELSEDISEELHELTELLSIANSSDSIVVIWDISSQMELNEVTKSTNSAHVKLLLLWLVTVSILSVTVSIEDVIVCSLDILFLILAWVNSVEGLSVFVVEGWMVDTLVQVVLCESDVEVSKVVDVDSEFEEDDMNGVSVSLNVWDGDAVVELDVEKEVTVEDGKLDKDVKSEDVEAVIDCELDVDILAVVESRVVEISVVFGGNFVEELVEDGKLDKDVKLGDVEAVIDCELDVDILAVVE